MDNIKGHLPIFRIKYLTKKNHSITQNKIKHQEIIQNIFSPAF